jgi:hypothetical protein
MNTKPGIKLIKNGQRKVPEIQAKVESTAGVNRWSRAVRSWVVEFRERDRSESLPAFDSFFRDALPQTVHAD